LDVSVVADNILD